MLGKNQPELIYLPNSQYTYFIGIRYVYSTEFFLGRSTTETSLSFT